MSKNNSHSASNKKVLPWVAFVILVLGASVIAALYWQQNLTVKSIEVSGNYFTNDEEIIEAAQVELGIKPDSLDLTNSTNRIENLHYVHSATPYVDALGRVNFDVIERFPIAVLINGDDEIYVDPYGVKLPIIAGKTQNLPLVYGFNARFDRVTLDSKEFIQIRDFLLSAYQDQFGWATISEIAFDSYDGVVALSHENGVKLLFGQDEFETKLKNWEAFYKEVIAVKGIQNMQQVDLRFTNQVVTREAGS